MKLAAALFSLVASTIAATASSHPILEVYASGKLYFEGPERQLLLQHEFDVTQIHSFMRKHQCMPVYVVFRHETSVIPGMPGGITRALQINLDVQLVSWIPPIMETPMHMHLDELLITNRLSGFARRMVQWRFIGRREPSLIQCGDGYDWAYVTYNTYEFPVATNCNSIELDKEEGEDDVEKQAKVRRISTAVGSSGHPTVVVMGSESIVTLSLGTGDRYGPLVLRQRAADITYDHKEFREIIVKDKFGLRPSMAMQNLIERRIEAAGGGGDGWFDGNKYLLRLVVEYIGGADGLHGIRCIARCMDQLSSQRVQRIQQPTSNRSSCCIIL